MKLNQEQTTYIENYIASFDIQFYEIYMEILNHLILGVEAILEEDKTISFEDAVLKSRVEGFRKLGLKGMMNQKAKLAHKKNSKENLKLIKEYFTFPKIVLLLSVFISYYIFLLLFENPVIANLICIQVVAFLGLSQMFYSWKFRKVENKFVLKTQVLDSMFAMSYLGALLANSFTIVDKETVDFNHILMRLFMTLIFTFSFISVLVYIEVRKKTIIELKNEIFA
jgi:hypothetical protein